MDGDDDDFVFYGTPIEREEDLGSRKKKAAAEASGQLRTLPAWKQEVLDEEGRRRFHGAFTGGFSAGYYNTVGSKEGWTPQTFTSSRKNRTEVKQQSILNFLDDDEKAELESRSLATSSQFDTFGSTVAEVARKQAEKEQQQRPSAIPGPIPDELLLPATDSIGVKLLLKMGWRRGHSIKELRADLQYDARREARKALLAFSSNNQRSNSSQSEPSGDIIDSRKQQFNHEVFSSQSMPVYVRNPKQDLYGLGYDPYKHAPEFREMKRARLAHEKEHKARKPLSLGESLFGLKSGKAAPGFGIGALEEYDVEDEDVYTTAYEFDDSYLKEVEEPTRSSVDHVQRLGWKEQDILPGFKAASNSDYHLERFSPPVIPRDFKPYHSFPGPLEAHKYAVPPPPEAPVPDDSNLKILIDGVASLVARCGQLFEDLSREKNRTNPSFSFLDGGIGHDYYVRKLWEEQQKLGDRKKVVLPVKSISSEEKLSAESRGKMLGEKPLERSSRDTGTSFSAVNINLQFNLSDTFTNSSSSNNVPEAAKPFKDDPVKQERFEQFLKEKYHGGLRTSESGGASYMSEAARARERLDFEAAAEAMAKGKWAKDGQVFAKQSIEFPAAGGLQFTSGGTEKSKGAEADNVLMKNDYPKREEFQWRPAPVLCKRFDLIDPFMGKPPPPPRAKSKLESLIFTPDFVKFTKMEETFPPSKESNTMLTLDAQETSSVAGNTKLEVEVEVENVERPVDLYKAIFSDDEDDDFDADIKAPNVNKSEDPEKKTEVAHTALSRLMAGDFLESLGKELGFDVPPEQPYPPTKVIAPALQKGTTTDAGNVPVGKTLISTPKGGDQSSSDQLLGNETRNGSQTNNYNTDSRDRYLGPSPSVTELDSDKVVEKNKSRKVPSIRENGQSSSSSSEDERSANRHHSRSRREKESSRKKKKSRRHSKHHKHRDRDSPSRSSRHSRKDERRKRKD